MAGEQGNPLSLACFPSSPSPFPSTFPSVFTATLPKTPVRTRLLLSPPDCPGDPLCTARLAWGSDEGPSLDLT